MMMTKRKTGSSVKETTESTVTSIKGFDSNLKCRGFQFEVGKTYAVDGAIEACDNGFHACPEEHHPLSVFEYYPPAGNRFFVVKQGGETDAEGTKLASGKITIDFELSLGDLTKRAVKWVFDRAKWGEGQVATGDNEGATASGTQGAATASGTRGAATASGYYGKVKGAKGNALFLVYRNDDGKIVHAWAGIVGKDGIAPDTWYSLNEDGKPVAA
jgi:hypothetical protein